MQVGLAVEAVARSCPRLRVLLFQIAAVQAAAVRRWQSVARCWKKLEWEGKRLATRRSVHWRVAVLPLETCYSSYICHFRGIRAINLLLRKSQGN
jgi:hypothetical protein